MLDASDGLAVGPPITGTEFATTVSAHIQRFRPGRTYVQIHTHPNSTSFSPDDVLFLATQPQVRTSIVVGIDGTWYLLSRLSDDSTRNPRLPYDDYRREYRQLEQEQVTSAERPHAVMERIAERHGFRYDRVTGS